MNEKGREKRKEKDTRYRHRQTKEPQRNHKGKKHVSLVKFRRSARTFSTQFNIYNNREIVINGFKIKYYINLSLPSFSNRTKIRISAIETPIFLGLFFFHRREDALIIANASVHSNGLVLKRT